MSGGSPVYLRTQNSGDGSSNKGSPLRRLSKISQVNRQPSSQRLEKYFMSAELEDFEDKRSLRSRPSNMSISFRLPEGEKFDKDKDKELIDMKRTGSMKSLGGSPKMQKSRI